MPQKELHIVLAHGQRGRAERLETDEEFVVDVPLTHPHAVRLRLPRALEVLLNIGRGCMQELLAQQRLGVVQIP